MILPMDTEEGYWDSSGIIQEQQRFRPGNSDVEELLVGHEKITEETEWQPQVSWEEGISRTIDWYANHEDARYVRVDWR